MMLRCISEVPPAIVSANVRRERSNHPHRYRSRRCAVRAGDVRCGQHIGAGGGQRVFRRRLRRLRTEKFEYRQSEQILTSSSPRGLASATEPSRRYAWLSITSPAYRSRSSVEKGRKSSTSSCSRSAWLSHSMFRSSPSDSPATHHPWFSRPTRFCPATRTSLKKTLSKSRSSIPRSDANGRRTTPGRSVGIISTLMPFCSAAFGSVRTSVDSTSASCGRARFLAVDGENDHRRKPRWCAATPIRSCARSAHRSRRGALGPQDRHRPAPLLVGCTERVQRRGNDADDLDGVRQVNTPPCQSC